MSRGLESGPNCRSRNRKRCKSVLMEDDFTGDSSSARFFGGFMASITRYGVPAVSSASGKGPRRHGRQACPSVVKEPTREYPYSLPIPAAEERARPALHIRIHSLPCLGRQVRPSAGPVSDFLSIVYRPSQDARPALAAISSGAYRNHSGDCAKNGLTRTKHYGTMLRIKSRRNAFRGSARQPFPAARDDWTGTSKAAGEWRDRVELAPISAPDSYEPRGAQRGEGPCLRERRRTTGCWAIWSG